MVSISTLRKLAWTYCSCYKINGEFNFVSVFEGHRPMEGSTDGYLHPPAIK